MMTFLLQLYKILYMKLILVFCTFLVIATSIPYRDQIALLNSLEVGRNEDPMTW